MHARGGKGQISTTTPWSGTHVPAFLFPFTSRPQCRTTSDRPCRSKKQDSCTTRHSPDLPAAVNVVIATVSFDRRRPHGSPSSYLTTLAAFLTPVQIGRYCGELETSLLGPTARCEGIHGPSQSAHTVEGSTLAAH
ncbi:hypothetical protein SVAN01_03412 [Stagonosporopsis vannaccii]|nr:hypothetical protein SVAN01_03412 [Stagonosporopsis vannaccii]